jgi:hypothetical protein
MVHDGHSAPRPSERPTPSQTLEATQHSSVEHKQDRPKSHSNEIYRRVWNTKFAESYEYTGKILKFKTTLRFLIDSIKIPTPRVFVCFFTWQKRWQIFTEWHINVWPAETYYAAAASVGVCSFARSIQFQKMFSTDSPPSDTKITFRPEDIYEGTFKSFRTESITK